jgi:hypothetical protein
MPKRPLSVTLDADNIRWLKSRAGASRRRSVSDALDRLVTEARLGGAEPGATRSVAGTVDIAADDPDLEHADQHIRALFAASAARPIDPVAPPKRAARRPRSRARG